MPQYDTDQVEDPDQLDCPLMAIAVDSGPHQSGEHSHQKSQLLYAVQGVMTITAGNQLHILTPNRAIWLPAGLKHSATTSGFHYRSLYFCPRSFNDLPEETFQLNVTALLRELILRVCHWPAHYPETGAETRLADVLVDEILNAEQSSLQLPLPADRRLQVVVQLLMETPSGQWTMEELAKQAGASARTLSRRFREETGMSFSHWRQQLVLLKALELLSEGRSVTEVSSRLGFASDSAFISMFRRLMGISPGRYLKQ